MSWIAWQKTLRIRRIPARSDVPVDDQLRTEEDLPIEDEIDVMMHTEDADA